MSLGKILPKSSNADDYFSDDSWNSDFDDSSEIPGYRDSTVYDDYSQEILENQINENLEAQIASIYVNTQPTNVELDASSQSAAVNKNSPNKTSTKNLGAIPKTAFTYLNNELDSKSLGENASIQRNAKNTNKLEDLSLTTINKSLQLLNQSDECENLKELKCGTSPNDSDDKAKQNDQTSFKPAVAPKPGKLKPGAFSFLNKVHENTSFIERQTLKPTVFTHSIEYKSASTSKADFPNSPEPKQSKCVSPSTTSPIFENSQFNPGYTNDSMFNSVVKIPNFPNVPNNIMPNPVTKTSKSDMTLIESGEESSKPPLPLRPPPIFNYPPDMFPQQPFALLKKEKCDQPNLTSSQQASPDHEISNFKDMSTRPLPPVPDRPLPKTPNINMHTDVAPIKVPFHDNMINLSSQETTSKTQNINLDYLEPKPFPPQRPKRFEDIIGNQTHVSNETFESQHKISAAIAARLQNISLRKSTDNSNLDPQPENKMFVLSEESSLSRSSGISKEPSNVNMSTQQDNSASVKKTSYPRKLSDIDELQNAMTRPCLPQKLRSTQRSLSCTSLVQTIKDMSLSIWNDKDKRNSEGSSSFEKTRNSPIQNKFKERSPVMEHSSISSNCNIIRKESTAREQTFEFNPSSDKISHIAMSRFPWFHDVDFKEAQTRLLTLGEDGTFLIRPSSRPTHETQYTTCVVYRRRVLNLRIRRHSDGQYALGITKEREKTFVSLSDMIKYYQDVPVEFHPDRSVSNQEPIYVCLRITPPK